MTLKVYIGKDYKSVDDIRDEDISCLEQRCYNCPAKVHGTCSAGYKFKIMDKDLKYKMLLEIFEQAEFIMKE